METEKKTCIAIILAAGSGSRMKSTVHKQYLLLSGHPVLYYSLMAFQKSPLIDGIVLVSEKGFIDYCRTEIVEKYGFSKVMNIVPGGKERFDSAYQGLLSCPPCDYVMIHDGARPFVTEEMLCRGYAGARETGACILAVPSKDTIKTADDGIHVSGTIDRKTAFIVQTPQIFRYSLIREAYERMFDHGTDGITDDAMAVEREMGVPVTIAEGSYRNIKITTPEDIYISEALYSQMQKNSIFL